MTRAENFRMAASSTWDGWTVRSKLHGVRVEPGEIESVLRDHPLVASARVVAIDDAEKRQLVGFYTTADAHRLEPEAVRIHLAGQLPRHLLPAALIWLERLPVNVNGKTDAAELTRIWQEDRDAHRRTTGTASPSGSIEDQVRKALQAVLDRAVPDANTTFFELGGNSLLLLKLARELERRTGYRPSIAELSIKHSVQSRDDGEWHTRHWPRHRPARSCARRAHTAPGAPGCRFRPPLCSAESAHRSRSIGIRHRRPGLRLVRTAAAHCRGIRGEAVARRRVTCAKSTPGHRRLVLRRSAGLRTGRGAVPELKRPTSHDHHRRRGSPASRDTADDGGPGGFTFLHARPAAQRVVPS